MPKAALWFNLPEEQSEFCDAQKGTSLKCAIEEIGNRVFRPARKHGYDDETIQALIDKNPDAAELVELLEKRFYDILKEYGCLND